jgi:microsomal epoxide hydrolase
MYLWNDLRPIVAEVRVPVLVIVRAEHRDQAEIVKSILANAEAEVFEDAGHALFVDDAERFNRKIMIFGEQVSGKNTGVGR